MRGYIKYLLLLILVSIPLFGMAQVNSTMRFEGDEWNFGTIREVDGPVEHTFVFRNSGRIAFVIEKVAVSCGCTTPTFSKDPIMPGEKGEITVSYNPKERPGVFMHDIHIASKKGRNKNVLKIRGEVIPRPRSIEEDYPFIFRDGIRVSQLSFNFGAIEQGEAKSMTVTCINTSMNDVLLAFEKQPTRQFLNVDMPTTLSPKERGEITLEYDLTQTTFYGRYSDRVYLIVNGHKELIPFSTTFTAIDSRKGVSLNDAPGVLISPMFHHFGDIKRSEGTLTRACEIVNDGLQPLIVRWVYSQSFMATTLKEGAVIEPGGAVEFMVTMEISKMNKGVRTGSVTVITNDPLRPIREIRLAVNIK